MGPNSLSRNVDKQLATYAANTPDFMYTAAEAWNIVCDLFIALRNGAVCVRREIGLSRRGRRPGSGRSWCTYWHPGVVSLALALRSAMTDFGQDNTNLNLDSNRVPPEQVFAFLPLDRCAVRDVLAAVGENRDVQCYWYVGRSFQDSVIQTDLFPDSFLRQC